MFLEQALLYGQIMRWNPMGLKVARSFRTSPGFWWGGFMEQTANTFQNGMILRLNQLSTKIGSPVNGATALISTIIARFTALITFSHKME